MNKFIASLCMLLTINSGVVRADVPDFPRIDVPPSENNVGEALSPLRKGQRAPFTGVLLSPAAVAKTTITLKSIEEEIQIEINKLKAEAIAQTELIVAQKKAEFDADISIIRANLEFSTHQRDALEKELIMERRTRPSRILWLSVGILAGSGITLTILFASHKLGI